MPQELSRVEKWEKTSEVPLLLLATAFLIAYAWPLLDPGMSPDLQNYLTIASWTVLGSVRDRLRHPHLAGRAAHAIRDEALV